MFDNVSFQKFDSFLTTSKCQTYTTGTCFLKGRNDLEIELEEERYPQINSFECYTEIKQWNSTEKVAEGCCICCPGSDVLKKGASIVIHCLVVT